MKFVSFLFVEYFDSFVLQGIDVEQCVGKTNHFVVKAIPSESLNPMVLSDSLGFSLNEGEWNLLVSSGITGAGSKVASGTIWAAMELICAADGIIVWTISTIAIGITKGLWSWISLKKDVWDL